MADGGSGRLQVEWSSHHFYGHELWREHGSHRSLARIVLHAAPGGLPRARLVCSVRDGGSIADAGDGV